MSALPSFPEFVRAGSLRRCLRRSLLPLAVTLATAGATSLDFGVSYAPAGGTLLEDGRLRVGVQDLPLAGFTVAAGLGTRGLDAALSRSLVLPGLGVARARAEVAALYSGGLRGGLSLSGTAGPVALTLDGHAWNAGLTRFDPLARWAEEAPDLRDGGAALGVSARYRLSREVVLSATGTLGGQSGVLAQAELRREALSYRFGLRAGQGVLGAALGATYTDPDSGLNAALDLLAGPNTFGLTGHLGADNVLGDGSSLRLFAAYEPWRTTSETLRYGAQVSLSLGAGTLGLEGYGGTRGAAGQGFGLTAKYLLPLDAPDSQEETPAQP